jgi:hypothetical protein
LEAHHLERKTDANNEHTSLLPGMPPRADDVYAADRPGQLSPVVRNDPSRVYVPNSERPERPPATTRDALL